jgi:hypothetical protein
MNQLVKAMQKQANKTETLNGAKAYKSTKNVILDLFSSWGGMRGKDIIPLLRNAIDDDLHLTLRCCLWGRDIRGGAGERELFRTSLKYLASNNFPTLYNILPKIPEVGRWDDLFVLHNTQYWNEVVKMVGNALSEGNGLCAKWMPRKGTIAEALRTGLGMSPKQYRKTLVNLTKVVETQMCANKWEEINYEHVPSKATQIYKNAFKRHTPEKYNAYLSSLSKGTAKINAGAVYPYEIIRQVNEPQLMEAQWKAQPDYVPEGISFLPIIDCSGSMGYLVYQAPKVQPLEVAISLGLYLSERNKSIFKNMFVTFSANPQFQYVKGNLRDRMKQMSTAEWGMHTNIQAVFDKLLDLAVKNRVDPKDMPTHMIIVSDMQFDRCCNNNNNQKQIMKQFKDAGYVAPILVFWNVNDHGNKPVTEQRENTVLVSGFSPSIMKTLLKADVESITPIAQMMETLMQERYNF